MHLRCSLDAAERQGYAASLLLLEALYAERGREAKFQAALHGAKMR